MEYSCSKCNGILIKCIATGGIKNFSVSKLPKKIFATKETSNVFPFVCSTCGYTWKRISFLLIKLKLIYFVELCNIISLFT